MKTTYYVMLSTPTQLVVSAIFQLLVDLAILLQIFLYQPRGTSAETEMEIVKSMLNKNKVVIGDQMGV